MNAPGGYTGAASYRAGFVTDIKIVGPLGARAEVSYDSYAIQQKFTASSATGAQIGNGKIVERSATIDIPVMVKLSTGVKVKPYYCIGAGPSVLMSAKMIYKNDMTIPNSTIEYGDKIDVSDNYNSLYWSLYNIVGFDLPGKSVTPFIEVRLKHSIGDITPAVGYGPLNSITANIGFKF